MKKKNRAPHRPRRLCLEGLEDRRLLATVSFNRAGLLTITGNGSITDGTADETVTITQDAPGQVTVAGDVTPTGNNFVDNEDGTFTYTGVRSLKANMNAGDDTVNIGEPDSPVELIGPITVNLGLGSDDANLSINTLGVVIVDGGKDNSQAEEQNQNDDVFIGGSNINRLTINTHAGDDSLTIVSSTIGSLLANMGVTSLKRNQTDRDTVNTGGPGETFVQDLVTIQFVANINLGVDNDAADLTMNTGIGGVVNINGGSDNSTAAEQNQNDEITILRSNIRTLIVNTYAGDDRLEVDDSAIGSLIANLGVNSLKKNQTDSDTIILGSGAGGGGGEEGDDAIEMLGPATITLGVDNDRAILYINTLGVVSVNGGVDNSTAATQNQDDEILVVGSIIGTLIVNTYAGNDVLDIQSSAIGVLNANLGVAAVRKNQTDSDLVLISSSAIGSTVINVGTAEKVTDDTPPDDDDGGPLPALQILDLLPGTNLVEVHSSLLGVATILGGNATDNILLDSEGDGLGVALDDLLVDLVDDLEPFIQSLADSGQLNSLWSLAESLFGVDMGPFSLGGINFEDDLSDQLRAFFDENPIDFLGDDTLVGLNLVINTLAGDDEVSLVDVDVNGLLSAVLLTGDDTLNATNVSARSVVLDGGPALNDTFNDFGGNESETTPIIVNFENFLEEELR